MKKILENLLAAMDNYGKIMINAKVRNGAFINKTLSTKNEKTK